MCAGSLTAGTSSSSQSPPDDEFETDTAVALPGDKMPMPGEQGIRAHDGFELLEHAAPQALRFGGQPNALVVGEPETARTELLSKDAILGLEIVDDLALLLVDPAGQGD